MVMSLMVGEYCTMMRERSAMKDFALEVRICFMALCITLIFRRLSMKGIGVQESDGEEVFSMIELGEWCTMESGSMVITWKREGC